MSTTRWPGLFITLEGGEGAGKSTQGRLLADWLAAAGHDVVQTREPGGSPGGEDIRALLVTGEAQRWTPLTEALLMNAARADHLARTIGPALARGAVVISDRFADSTEAYQGAGGGLTPEIVATLRAVTVGDAMPDHTFIFDLPAETGLARAASRGGEARFESKGLAYHQRLRDAFLAIAAREPERCTVIDATLSIESIQFMLRTKVEVLLKSEQIL